MSHSAERPRRFAPKKVDPNFITETIHFHSPPKSPADGREAIPAENPEPKAKKPKLSPSLPSSKPSGNNEVKAEVAEAMETAPPPPKHDGLPNSSPCAEPEKKEDDAPETADATQADAAPASPAKPPEAEAPLDAEANAALPVAAVKIEATLSGADGSSPASALSGDGVKVKKKRGRPPGIPNKKKGLLSPLTGTPFKPKHQSPKVNAASPKPKPLAADGAESGKASGRITASVANKCGATRPCDISRCPAKAPVCFVSATERCSGAAWTSRWYHVTAGEHYCNNCFEHFYRSTKDGYKIYESWKRVWSSNGKTEPTLRQFMTNQQMPYWVRCNKCSKWRQLARRSLITPAFIRSFHCGQATVANKSQPTDDAACQTQEDHRASDSQSAWWSALVQSPSFLQTSPASAYLDQYYPDCVGISAYVNVPVKQHNGTDKGDKEGSGKGKYLQAFLQPEDCDSALSLRPDVMTDEEIAHFPALAKEQHVYLCLRNLVVALWHLQPKELLTLDHCHYHVVCRGLSRIFYMGHLADIHRYLTVYGYINTGLVQNVPQSGIFPSVLSKVSVLIVGAGPAGLGAARQLHNWGCRVRVVEARDRIDGRVCDDHSLGQCVGRGAQIVNGALNSPMALVCHQLEQPIYELSDQCQLIDEAGQVMDGAVDSRIAFHFNAMLDNVAQWRKDRKKAKDIPLMYKIQDMHKQFMEESRLSFSQSELKLLQFHYSNLEYACGSDLTNISSHYWDQNESYPQFTGPHCLLPEGYGKLLHGLADGLDVNLQQEVCGIDFSGADVSVRTKTGAEFRADKVIITLPLAVLKRHDVVFTPPLPRDKLHAIETLGAGIVEKVALQFPVRFWRSKVVDADLFGHVPEKETDRGLFSIFHDITPKERDSGSGGMLVSYLSGRCAQLVITNTDEQIVDLCLQVLRKLFPEEVVMEPSAYFVTRWQQDKYAGMAYSYLPVGCSGATYDTLAATLQDKVYFAGEATTRHYPQTVTGAYLSGLREARAILHSLCPESAGMKPPPGSPRTSSGATTPKARRRTSSGSRATNGTTQDSAAGKQAQGVIKEEPPSTGDVGLEAAPPDLSSSTEFSQQGAATAAVKREETSGVDHQLEGDGEPRGQLSLARNTQVLNDSSCGGTPVSSASCDTPMDTREVTDNSVECQALNDTTVPGSTDNDLIVDKSSRASPVKDLVVVVTPTNQQVHTNGDATHVSCATAEGISPGARTDTDPEQNKPQNKGTGLSHSTNSQMLEVENDSEVAASLKASRLRSEGGDRKNTGCESQSDSVEDMICTDYEKDTPPAKLSSTACQSPHPMDSPTDLGSR